MSAQSIAQVASFLNVSPNQIKRCEEWASVLFVVVHGRRPQFVSKKVVAMSQVEVLKVAHTWGGDNLVMASVDGEKKIFISRFISDCSFGGKSFMAKDVTDRAKGMTVAQMMDWHFDSFYALPLTDDSIANQLAVSV